MTKLILLTFLLGLQNPLPAWRISESQPPHEETVSVQYHTCPDDAGQYSRMFFADFFYGHYGHHRSNDGTDDSQGHSSSNGSTLILTVFLVIITAAQCGVYVWQARLMRESIDHARESSQRELRAYIGIVDIVEEAKGVRIKFCNKGATPARKVTLGGWPTVKPSGDGHHLTSQQIRKQGEELGMSTTYSSDATAWKDIESSFLIKIGDWEILKGFVTYIAGFIYYTDVFNERQWVCFQFTMDFKSKKWEFHTCNEGNDAS